LMNEGQLGKYIGMLEAERKGQIPNQMIDHRNDWDTNGAQETASYIGQSTFQSRVVPMHENYMQSAAKDYAFRMRMELMAAEAQLLTAQKEHDTLYAVLDDANDHADHAEAALVDVKKELEEAIAKQGLAMPFRKKEVHRHSDTDLDQKIRELHNAVLEVKQQVINAQRKRDRIVLDIDLLEPMMTRHINTVEKLQGEQARAQAEADEEEKEEIEKTITGKDLRDKKYPLSKHSISKRAAPEYEGLRTATSDGTAMWGSVPHPEILEAERLDRLAKTLKDKADKMPAGKEQDDVLKELEMVEQSALNAANVAKNEHNAPARYLSEKEELLEQKKEELRQTYTDLQDEYKLGHTTPLWLRESSSNNRHY